MLLFKSLPGPFLAKNGTPPGGFKVFTYLTGFERIGTDCDMLCM